MNLVGFNFTKVSAERFAEKLEKLKIETKIDLKNIEELKSDFLKSKESIIKVDFGYDIEYSPKIANLSFKGNIILSMDQKEAKEILNQWKDKKLLDNFRIVIFNIILRKSNIQALELEDKLNLPLHFKLPSLNLEKKGN